MGVSTVDGVPVFHHDVAVPFSAGLVFGVGRRDESFTRGGITHLVEHLVMRAIGRTSLECNASVDMDVTEFTATGRPERVAEFLLRVCEVVSDLPTDQLRIEADVLRAEGSLVTHPFAAAMCAEIFGGNGIGLAGHAEPALRSLTADDVRGWAGRYFTRATAALWIAGPVPAGLSLPLQGGDRIERTAQRVLPLRTPALTKVPGEGFVGLAAQVPRTPALNATCRILRDRVEDQLRHHRGLSYAVDFDQIQVDRGHRLAVVVADVRDGQEAVAARTLWNTLRGLAEDGATEAELAHERTGLAEYLDGPGSIADEVRAAACAYVTGIPAISRSDLRSEGETIAAANVRAVAESLRAGAVLGVPEEIDLSLADLTPVPEWSTDLMSGPVFRRRIWSSAPRGARLVLGDEGVSVILGEDRRLTVRYADAIGLVEDEPGDYKLVGDDGFTVPICRRDWRNGAAVVVAVRAAVPAELQVRADPEDGQALTGSVVVLLRAAEHEGREALWPTGQDAWFLPVQRWCVLVPAGGGVERLTSMAAGASTQLGKRRAVIVLARVHDEVSYTLFRDGREVDQHVWTGLASGGDEQGDAASLARALDRADLAAELADLLSTRAEAAKVVDLVIATLELPAEVRRLLDGERPDEVGLDLVPALGLADGMRATFRGEFDPPDGWTARYERWRKERPRSYRVVSLIEAPLLGVVAWWAASRAAGDWVSWWGLLAAVAAGSAVYGLWDTYRQRRQRLDA